MSVCSLISTTSGATSSSSSPSSSSSSSSSLEATHVDESTGMNSQFQDLNSIKNTIVDMNSSNAVTTLNVSSNNYVYNNHLHHHHTLPISVVKPSTNLVGGGENKTILTLVPNGINSLSTLKGINIKDQNYSSLNMKAISNDSINFTKTNYVNYETTNNANHKSPPMAGLANSNFSVVSLKSPTSAPTFPWQQQQQQQQQFPSQQLNMTQSVITTTPLNHQAMSNSNKQIFRNQSVMVSNKLVQNLNRNVQSDPVQYVVKNSPNNQRIVILTKPTASTIATPTTINVSNNNNDLNRASIHLADTSNSNILIPITSTSNDTTINNSNTGIVYTMSNILNQSGGKIIKSNTISSHLLQQQQQQQQNQFNNTNAASILKPITLIPVNNLSKDSHLIYKFNNDLINNGNNNNSLLLNSDGNNNFNGIHNFNNIEKARSNSNKALEISEAEIEISTATVEIDTSEIEIETCEIECEAEEVVEEIKTSETMLPEEKNTPIEDFKNIKRRSSALSKTSKYAQNSDDITRCICGMDHDDGYMICCDQCLAWQHLVCMGVNRKKIPNKFFCEKCQPRSVNVLKAIKLQNKYLAKKAKKSNNQSNNDEDDTSDIEDENDDTENEETRKYVSKTNENNCNILRLNSNNNADISMGNQDSLAHSSITKNSQDDYSKLERHSESNEINDRAGFDEILKKPTKLIATLNAEDLKNTSIENNKENGNDLPQSSSIDNKKETNVKKKYRAKTIREELEKTNSNNPIAETNENIVTTSLGKKTKLKKIKLNYEYSEEFLKLIPPPINMINFDEVREALKNKTSNLKLVKISNKDETTLNETNENYKSAYRIKSIQNLMSNQFLSEYVGKVMKLEEYDSRENPFVIFYSMNSDVICIDSSSFKNTSRFIRKSCVPNCELKHTIDDDGDVHFLIFTKNSIEKGAEITLPFDFERISINKENFQHFTCSCGKKKCKINEHNRFEPPTENTNKNKPKNVEENPINSPAAKRKRENSTENAKKTNLLIEDKVNLVQTPIKKECVSTATNQFSAHKKQTSNDVVELKVVKKENTHTANEITSKNMSREDRKLMSYMRVIEKLEKQNLKKKELKQVKTNNDAGKNEKEPQHINKNIEVENKREAKIGLTNKTVTNKEDEKLTQEQANDNEIATIIENGQKATKSKEDLNKSNPTVSALTINSTNADLSNNKSSEQEKPLVKSPDFSFVNLSIKPRQTLSFLQRNLSSSPPLDFFTYDHFRISVDTNPSTYKQTESALSSPTSSQQPQQNVFNPKKYWLKCSSVSSEITETNIQSPTQSVSNISNQPLKKRRHLFQDCDDSPHHSSFNDASNDCCSDLGIEQKFAANLLQPIGNYSNPPIYQTCISAPLESTPSSTTPNNAIFSSNSFENNLNAVPYSLMQNQISVNEQNSQSCDESVNLNEKIVAAAALEAQKRKKVSLADYRRRKETSTNSNTDSNDNSMTIENKNEKTNLQKEDSESEKIEPTLERENLTESNQEIDTFSLKSENYKSKLSIKLNEIFEKKSSVPPSTSTLRLSSYLFEEKHQPNSFPETENLRSESNQNSYITPSQFKTFSEVSMSKSDLKEENTCNSNQEHLNIEINTDGFLMNKTPISCQEDEEERIFFNHQSTPIPKSNLLSNTIDVSLDLKENFTESAEIITASEKKEENGKRKKSSKKSTDAEISDYEFEDKKRRSRSISRSNKNKSPSRRRRSLSRASSSINSSNTSLTTGTSLKCNGIHKKSFIRDSEKGSPNLSLASGESLSSLDENIDERKVRRSKQRPRLSVSPVKLSDIKEKNGTSSTSKHASSNTKNNLVNESASRNKTYDYDEGELDSSSLSGRSRNACNFNYSNDFETDNYYNHRNANNDHYYHYFDRSEHQNHHDRNSRLTKGHSERNSHRENRSTEREYKGNSQFDYHNYLQYSPGERHQIFHEASHSQRYNYGNGSHFYRETPCAMNDRYYYQTNDLDYPNHRYKSHHYQQFDNSPSYQSRCRVRSLSRDSRRRSREKSAKKYLVEEVKTMNSKYVPDFRSKSRSISPFYEDRKKNKTESSYQRLEKLEFGENKKLLSNEYLSEKEYKSKISTSRKRYDDESSSKTSKRQIYKEAKSLENEKRYANNEDELNEYDYYNESNQQHSSKYHSTKALPKFDLRNHLNKNYYNKSNDTKKQTLSVTQAKSSASNMCNLSDSLNNSFESLTPQNSTKTLSINTTSSTSSLSSNTSNLSNYSTSSSSSLIDSSCTEHVKTSRKTINLEKIKKRPSPSDSTSRNSDIKRVKE